MASVQFAKNSPLCRIRQTFECGPEYGYLEIWIFGYLDIWMSGYLDSGQNNVLMHPQSGLLCGAALPFFFSSKN